MADRYVSPTGSGTACTRTAPGALSDAFNNSNGVTIAAGDVVWLRAGTYTGSGTYNYTQSISGTATAPIVYRAWPGERVIIDSNGATSGGVDYTGSWVTLRDIEFTDSDTVRASLPSGIWMNFPGNTNVKFINCIFHDQAAHGAALWSDNVELYGSLMYYNGNATNQKHGTYFSQTNQSTRVIDNNIAFDNGGYGFHGYAVNDAHYNVRFANNIGFQSGRLASDTPQGANILIGENTGSPQPLGQNIQISNNYTYDADATGFSMLFGYVVGLDNTTFTNNYGVGGDFRWYNVLNRRTTMTGNFFEGNMWNDGTAHVPTAAQWPGNTFTDDGGQPGAGKVIYVIPNKYEAGRGHVAVFNWDSSSTVAVDLSTVVTSGDDYAVYWAPKFAAKTAALTGTYAGGTVNFPMTAGVLGAMPNPVDPAMMQPPTTTLPEFAAFVVQTTKRRS